MPSASSSIPGGGASTTFSSVAPSGPRHELAVHDLGVGRPYWREVAAVRRPIHPVLNPPEESSHAHDLDPTHH